MMMKPTNTPPETAVTSAKYLFVDLENLAFIAGSLQHLSFAASHRLVEFRAYSAPDHSWANRATHWSRSCEKEAVDVRIV